MGSALQGGVAKPEERLSEWVFRHVACGVAQTLECELLERRPHRSRG